MRDDSAVFSAGGPCELFWHGQGCSFFHGVHPAFLQQTTASPILQGALKDGVGEAVVACDMPEPCKFPSLGSARRGSRGPTRKLILLRTQSCAQSRRYGEVSSCACFRKPGSFFFYIVSKQGPGFKAIEADKCDKRLLEFEPVCKADDVAQPDPV